MADTALLEAESIPETTAAEPTPETLLTMPDGDRFELINGQLVERHMGAESSQVAATIIALLRQHVRAHQSGKVFATDCGYQIFANEPRRVRYPDGSFIARGRLPNDEAPKGHVPIPPDLAVEVVSPNDLAEEVEAKWIDFLRAGTRLVWVVYPEAKTVHVYRLDGTSAVVTEAGDLAGEAVLPGFTCRVAEIFA
jgi:Uma2 family endonuclease